MVIGNHLVFSGYGTWLSNDLRGSGSHETRKPELDELGPTHFGRKPDDEQPTRREIRDFYREAEELLKYETLWFREAHRIAIGNAFGMVIRERGYTCWAGAVCSNHGHICVRNHRDSAEEIWYALACAARIAVRRLPGIDPEHPVWSERPYKVFLRTPAEVRTRVNYIRLNPVKEGLPIQEWDWITPYDGFPFHKRGKGRR